MASTISVLVAVCLG